MSRPSKVVNAPNPGPPTTWYESNFLWVPLGVLLTLAAAKFGWWCWFLIAWLCLSKIIWREAGRTKEIWLVRILGILLLGAALWGLNVWLRPSTNPSVATVKSDPPKPAEQPAQTAIPPAVAPEHVLVPPITAAEARKVVYGLRDNYIKAHPQATTQQVMAAVNSELAKRHVDAHLSLAPASRTDKKPGQSNCDATTELDGVHIDGVRNAYVNDDPHRCDSFKNVIIEHGETGIFHGGLDPDSPLSNASSPFVPPSTAAPGPNTSTQPQAH